MARNKRISEWAGFILGIGLILAILQLGNHLQGKRAIFPTAAETLQALQSLLSRKSTYTEIGTTLIQVVQSVAFSAFIGIVLGTAEGIVPFLHSLLRPLYALLRSIPLIVLGMIMLVATRFSKTLMPVWTGCLILVPMISEAAYEGFNRIDSDLIDVYRLDSGMKPSIILRVYLPLMNGYIRPAFINACGMGLKVIITAEYLVHTSNSLGQAVFSKLDSIALECANVFAYGLMMVALVLLLTGIPTAITRIVNRIRKEGVTSG